MRCKHCNTNLAVHDLWCAHCGHQSPAVKQDLSASKSLKQTWEKYKLIKGANVPAATLAIVLGIIPIVILLVVMLNFGFLELLTIKSIGTLLTRLALMSIGLSVFVPILLLPFKPVAETDGYGLSIKSVLSAFSSYPRYLLFSLFSALFYALIYLICFGLPNFGSDPILRLVWIVLVNYFFAVVLPVPILMERKGLNAWKAIKTSYKYFHVVRWQLYLMALVLGLLNAIAFLLILIPLLISIPFSWFAIRDYTDKLLAFEIIRENP